MEKLREHSARYVRHVFLANGSNKKRTCDALGIAYHTLQGYLKDPSLAGDPIEGQWRGRYVPQRD